MARQKGIEAFDFLVNVLREYEKDLSRTTTKLGEIAERFRKMLVYGPPVVARCKYWENFKFLSANAEIVSFLSREAEKILEVDALKENLILSYSGDFPEGSPQQSLKTWLSRELNVAEERIFEGVLAIK